MGRKSNKKKKTDNLAVSLGSGKALERPARQRMESYFQHDFSEVRIYSGERPAQLAGQASANAFTVGNEIVFGRGKYQPGSPEGQELLAHELSHVIQQEKEGTGNNAEGEARQTAAGFSAGRPHNANTLGGAPAGVYKQDKKEKAEPEPKQEKGPKEVKVDVKPDALAKPEKKDEAKAPAEKKLPSRLPVPWLTHGSFSVGLRLGFPKPESKNTGMFGPDPLKESLQRARIINQALTGKAPSGWESTDKGKLAEAAWGIFSTHIAPGLASKVADGLKVPTDSGRFSYELDAILITDFSKEIGGGISFTLKWK